MMMEAAGSIGFNLIISELHQDHNTSGSTVTDMTVCACFRDPLGWNMVMYGGFLLAKWIPLF